MSSTAERCSICDAPLDGEISGLPRYITCGACGTSQLRPLPQSETNTAFTGDQVANHMAAADEARTGYLLRRLMLLQKPLSDITAPRFLDVGCSSGKVLKLASDRGWSVTGIEMSPELAAEARRQNPQAHILEGDVLQMDFAHIRQFDAIVALDVIEHVLRPGEFIRRLHGLLMPGGQLVLQTPNARSLRARLHGQKWNMLIPEYHFHLFTPESLRMLLENEGFVVDMLTTVSGTGVETGVAAMAAVFKEKALATFNLGNALLVKASKS